MLVLSRKINEKIVIDGNITVVVVSVERNKVKLGIEAPHHVDVMREELLSQEPRRLDPPHGGGRT